MSQRESLSDWVLHLWRHLWQNEQAAWQAVPDAMAERLARRVQASEQRHSGQIRLCVEGALPMSYAWRAGRTAARAAVVRQRALAWFGRLQVWDTECNNGVLIYLLLAERRIEIVADRGLQRHADVQVWQAVVDRLASHLRAGQVEDGLTQALEEVSALLVRHFPLPEGAASANELPNALVRA
jgi:uncharacterized membrane protein